MRRTKEEALLTRKDLLSAALQVFSRYGYSATRLEDIAESAGVTRGAIYHHFGGKEELYRALVTERSAGVNELATEILAGGGTPKVILQRLMVEMFAYLAEDDEYRAFLELAMSKVEVSEGLKSLQRDTIKGRRVLLRVFEELMREGIRLGEFRSDLEVESAAYALLSFMNGVGFIWIQDPHAFSLRENVESLAEVFMRGIEPCEG